MRLFFVDEVCSAQEIGVSPIQSEVVFKTIDLAIIMNRNGSLW